MTVQQNIYKVVGDIAELQCVQRDGTSISAIFPSELKEYVSACHWYLRGKYGIYNGDFGSLANYIADVYGFDNGKWNRRENNEDYFPRNYKVKTVVNHKGNPQNLIPAIRKPIEFYNSQKFERVKWTSKYKCELLELTALRYGYPSKLKVTILLNTYLRIYVSKYCIVRTTTNGTIDICTPDGIPLRKHVLACAMGCDVSEIPSITYEANKTNELDFRIDPNENMYVATPRSVIRRHTVEDGVLLEIRQRGAEVEAFGWGGRNPLFCCPVEATKYYERVAYLLVDTVTSEKIDNIWYNAVSHDFTVSDIIVAGNRPLKYLVADLHGIKYKDIYFEPRMTNRYANAIKNAGDKGKWDKLKYKIENAMGDERASVMFTRPKYLTRRSIEFNVIGFNDTIYGGVGIHYLDCRAIAIHIPGYKNPLNDKTKIVHHEQLSTAIDTNLKDAQ